MKALKLLTAALALVGTLAATSAQAGAIHDSGLFTGNTLAANDDGSTGLVPMGFAVNFFGFATSSLFVNNNGNITFDAALGTFTPFPLLSTTRKIIAPFFADVDTRGAGSGLTQYGTSTLGGKSVFGVNWINVGYFGSHVDKLNSFQLIMTDRSDTGAGNFDFEFNYDKIQWETGDASGGTGGLGGFPARVGWSNGSTTAFELAGSASTLAFLDGGPSALITHSLNSTVSGRYVFNVRSGVIVGVPEPGTLLLAAFGVLALAGAGRRRQVRKQVQ